MIDMNLVRGYYPPYIRENANFDKHLLKEYIQLMILDFLSSTPYMKKLAFIGGTNLRLVKGIDRFSEDLDFDCKDMEQEDFMQMTDDVLLFLHRNGLEAIVRDKENSRLSAFRRNIYFPQLLFDMGLSHHKDERFLIKIEAQNQNIDYHK
ncbi:MAG: nucleotidyl transferase AbiEii/AbiGii toxin family protein, partial [Bacteroidales bacterium]|nr:nucleotidyl transferase AbiEii/AbiGii toxin family protein [Bacteroidales bacterium]